MMLKFSINPDWDISNKSGYILNMGTWASNEQNEIQNVTSIVKTNSSVNMKPIRVDSKNN